MKRGYIQVPTVGLAYIEVVHYDQPAGWRAVVEPFVLECESLA